MSRDQNAGRFYSIELGNHFEVRQFKILGTTLINKNGLHKDIYRGGNKGWCRLYKKELYAL
jgi:hypothetical protein